MVSIGFVTETDVECPFHEETPECNSNKNTPNTINEGDANELGKNLHAGGDASSTVRRDDKPYSDWRTTNKRHDPDLILDYDDLHVPITVPLATLYYPVAFSAHHLIPAKESLKKVKSLHGFMKKKKGKFCCNLGYNVDGNENGVWLPGLHAVNSKGIDKWGSAEEKCPDMESARFLKKMAKYQKDKSLPGLDGPRNGDLKQGDDPMQMLFVDDNLKWLYVSSAMNFKVSATLAANGTIDIEPDSPDSPRQFHDRHPTYSAQVESHLTAVARVLEHFQGSPKKPPGCSKCPQPGENVERHAPAKLLGWLNKLSFWCKKKLLGQIQDDLYFTSSWCGPKSQANQPLHPIKPTKKPKS